MSDSPKQIWVDKCPDLLRSCSSCWPRPHHRILPVNVCFHSDDDDDISILCCLESLFQFLNFQLVYVKYVKTWTSSYTCLFLGFSRVWFCFEGKKKTGCMFWTLFLLYVSHLFSSLWAAMFDRFYNALILHDVWLLKVTTSSSFLSLSSMKFYCLGCIFKHNDGRFKSQTVMCSSRWLWLDWSDWFKLWWCIFGQVVKVRSGSRELVSSVAASLLFVLADENKTSWDCFLISLK